MSDENTTLFKLKVDADDALHTMINLNNVLRKYNMEISMANRLTKEALRLQNQLHKGIETGPYGKITE